MIDDRNINKDQVKSSDVLGSYLKALGGFYFLLKQPENKK